MKRRRRPRDLRVFSAFLILCGKCGKAGGGTCALKSERELKHVLASVLSGVLIGLFDCSLLGFLLHRYGEGGVCICIVSLFFGGNGFPMFHLFDEFGLHFAGEVEDEEFFGLLHEHHNFDNHSFARTCIDAALVGGAV